MKHRVYARMTMDGVKQVDYDRNERVRYIFKSPEVEVHVYGTFKHSGLDYARMQYGVMLLVQENGGKVGQLYREKP